MKDQYIIPRGRRDTFEQKYLSNAYRRSNYR